MDGYIYPELKAFCRHWVVLKVQISVAKGFWIVKKYWVFTLGWTLDSNKYCKSFENGKKILGVYKTQDYCVSYIKGIGNVYYIKSKSYINQNVNVKCI